MTRSLPPCDGPLLDREQELAILDDLLCRCVDERDAVALVNGEAGVGKTRLLHAAAARARAAGVRVLVARGSPFEQAFTFGVVRQLFEAPLHAATDRVRQELLSGAAGLAARLLLQPLNATGDATSPGLSVDDAGFGMLHSLYWLLVNLSDTAPTLVTIDDLQWADELSQRFVLFCASRTAGLPIGIQVAARAEGVHRGSVIDMLERLPDICLIRPGPLSPAAVSELLTSKLGMAPERGFVESCRAVTGGIPFYLCELADELARGGVEPVNGNVGRVADTRPETLVHAVMARLADLPHDAIAVAHALSVLDTRATLDEVTTLAQVDLESAIRALDELAEAGICAPDEVAFQHPILANAVYGDISLSRREELHSCAAAALRAKAVPAERVATHLLRCKPAAAPDTVETLRQSAAAAYGRGAADDAVTYLHRALAEPPAPGLRPRLLLELGAAQLRAWSGDAVPTLQAAFDTVAPELRGRAALVLCQALSTSGRSEEAARLADATAVELETSDPSLSLWLELWAVSAGRSVQTMAAFAVDRMPALAAKAEALRSTDACFAFAAIAANAAFTNQPVSGIADLIRRAFPSDAVVASQPPDNFVQSMAPIAMIMTDEFDIAERWLTVLATEAQRQGAIIGLGAARLLGTWSKLRRGRLLDAETDAWEALAIARDHPSASTPMILGLAAEICLERGNLDQAETFAFDHDISQQVATNLWYSYDLFARGLVLLARHRYAAALGELRALGCQLQLWQASGVAYLPWRSYAALAAYALGDHSTAQFLAREELDLAEDYGAPRPLAVAMRTASLVAATNQPRLLLERSVDLLDGHPAQLEKARSLVALGALLCRQGAVSSARDKLRQGLDLATRAGAVTLAEHARSELRGTGARPRRAVLTGAAALTPAERRVAQLAAQGSTNRDIAQTLFVSIKTVELHLTNTYRKLSITHRSQLPNALTANPTP